MTIRAIVHAHDRSYKFWLEQSHYTLSSIINKAGAISKVLSILSESFFFWSRLSRAPSVHQFDTAEQMAGNCIVLLPTSSVKIFLPLPDFLCSLQLQVVEEESGDGNSLLMLFLPKLTMLLPHSSYATYNDQKSVENVKRQESQ